MTEQPILKVMTPDQFEAIFSSLPSKVITPDQLAQLISSVTLTVLTAVFGLYVFVSVFSFVIRSLFGRSQQAEADSLEAFLDNCFVGKSPFDQMKLDKHFDQLAKTLLSSLEPLFKDSNFDHPESGYFNSEQMLLILRNELEATKDSIEFEYFNSPSVQLREKSLNS